MGNSHRTLNIPKLLVSIQTEDVPRLLKYMTFKSFKINEPSITFACQCRELHIQEPFTLMHYTASNSTAKILLLLETYGANVNEKTVQYELTPLMLAVIHQKIENVYTLCYFLKCDKNVKDATMEENTALHHACKLGYKQIVEKLVDLGVDINVRNKLDKTARDVAVFYGHQDIADLLPKDGVMKRQSSNISNTMLLKEINVVKKELQTLSERTPQHGADNLHENDTTRFGIDDNPNRKLPRRSESICVSEKQTTRDVAKITMRRQVYSDGTVRRSKISNNTGSCLSQSADDLAFHNFVDIDGTTTPSISMKTKTSQKANELNEDSVDLSLKTSTPNSSGPVAGSAQFAGDSAVDVHSEAIHNDSHVRVISELHHHQIRTNYEQLVRMMRPEQVITKMYAIGDLDDDDRDTLHSVGKRNEKNKYILKHIQNGSEEMFENFIDILEASNQRALVKLINSIKTVGSVSSGKKKETLYKYSERRAESEWNLPTYTRECTQEWNI